MRNLPPAAAACVVAAALLPTSSLPPAVAQQAQTPAPAQTKSVRGTLVSVDTGRNSLVVQETNGGQMGWHFDAPVVAEAAKFKAGDPVIVIYRQTSPKEKRVTALAFPGSAQSPIYKNLTGDRVVLRSAAGVGGACDETSGAVTESVIPNGGFAEIADACWCCAPVGGTCTPGTRSGQGKAFLAQCFR